jgi:hypothetical protein
MKQSFIIFLLCISSLTVFAQGIDISDYLKKIESGQLEEVKRQLPDLKAKYPDDPSVLFLDGILTENGKTSVKLFSTIVNNFPESRYADAAVFRIYSYYYAGSQMHEAANWFDRLKKDYPSSPYIKIAEKNDLIQPVDKKKNTENVNSKTQKIKYKYTIQAGAFGNKENAETLYNQFITAGFTSEINEKTVAGTQFHVVYVGKFNSEDEAKKFLKQINSEYKLAGRIIPAN